MRLLFLTPRLPYPPDRGDRLRAYHFLRALSQEHTITLVSFITSQGQRPFLDHLRPFCESIHVVVHPTRRAAITAAANIWRSEPLQTLYYRSSKMKKLLDDLLTAQAFDAAYIHLFRMAPYLENQPQLVRVLDLTDLISTEITLSLPYRSWFWRGIYQLELPRIRRYEQAVAQRFDEVWVISAADRDGLTAVAPQAHVQIVPNGVEMNKLPQQAGPKAPNLLFVGHMGVFHNIDAARYLAREILPLVSQSVPECRLQLVGAGVGPAVQQLGRLPGVTVMGFVPDLGRVMQETAVFVAPLRFAAGVQNKVLEAMAAGVPVVATPLVNRGLGGAAEHDLLIGGDAESLAAQIVRLLRDPDLRVQIGLAGRQFVDANFSWQIAAQRMQSISTRI